MKEGKKISLEAMWDSCKINPVSAQEQHQGRGNDQELERFLNVKKKKEMEMLKKNQTEILELKKIKIKTSAENITNKKDLVEEQIQKGGWGQTVTSTAE